MAIRISSNGPKRIQTTDHFDYDYPGGLNLKPGSELHDRIVSEVTERSKESYMVMSGRQSDWNKIDRTLTAYIPIDEAEQKIKDDDERKPVSIVVPLSYAAMDTILTYWISAFLNEPYFRYTGVGSVHDVIGAGLMEHVINVHCMRNKVGLQLYTFWRDCIAYGIGAVSPTWVKQMGMKATIEEQSFFSSLFSSMRSKRIVRKAEQTVLFEGNKLINIDPYCFLPDANTPIHNVQDGEDVGWLDRDNYMGLLNKEATDDRYFNVRYLHDTAKGYTSLMSSGDTRRSERYGMDGMNVTTKARPMDVLYRYISLIPKEWKLGTSEYPEKWFFGVAADSIVVCSQPLGLNHGMFPVCVGAPEFDGYSITPVSELELTYGMQETIDWLFSTKITNVRKALHDMFIVDPYLVNMADLRQPGPGKFMRMRKSAWGKGKVQDAIHQFPVNDVTSQHFGDVGFILDLMQRVSGASESLMGMQRKTSERITATEVRGARGGALGRLEKAARIVSMQAHNDVAYMFASHTQQLMTNDQYVKITDDVERQLLDEYGVSLTHDRMAVSPKDIIVEYDVIQHDASIPSGEYADTWLELYRIGVSDPTLAPEIDNVKIFKHLARLMGAKNIGEFIKRKNVEAKVMPNQQVEKQVQAGNLIPLEEAANAAPQY